MIKHEIDYVKIPHPLEKGKGDIAISDPRKLAKSCFNAWLDDKRTKGPAKLPQILRVLITPDKTAEPRNPDLVKRFERNAGIQDEHKWNVAKLRIFLSIARDFAIGYFIYWTIFNFPLFWLPGELVLRTFLNDTLTKLFMGIAVGFVPGLSIIRNFLGGKRWPIVNFQSKYTEIYSKFGQNNRSYFTKQVTKTLGNIRREASSQKVALELTPLENLLEEILTKHEVDVDFAKNWNERFEGILEDFSQRAKEVAFWEGVVLNLDQLRSDLLLHYLEGFQLVPLKIVTLNSTPQDIFPKLGLGFDSGSSLLAEGCIQKSNNLKEFLDETRSVREEIYRAHSSLGEAKTKDERVGLLEIIEEGFEQLRNIAGNYHFGDNPRIPQERGVNLSDLYDKLFFLFGRAKLDILDGKRAVRAVVLRRLPVKTNRQQKARINRLKFEVERFLCQGVEHKKTYEKVSHAVSFWGKTWIRSLAFAGLLLFIFSALLSVKILGPDQVLSAHYLRMGVKEQATQESPLFSRGIKTYRFGEGIPVLPGKEIFFNLPAPLVFAHKIDFNKEQKFEGHIIMAASTDTLFKRGLVLLGGDMGKRFWIIEFSFNYVPKDKTLWSAYDYDGKGYLRLQRDASIVLEQWQMHLFDYREGPLVDISDQEEMNKVFSEKYLKKLWSQGTLQEIIERQIFKDPQATYQYGTVGDRINPGIEMILDGIERDIKNIELERLPAGQKEERLAELEAIKNWLEGTKKRIYEQIKHEYGTLRESPEEFKKYLNDYRNIGELRNFETIWWAIQSVLLQQYASDKLIMIINGELGQETKAELINSLVEKIQEEEFLSSRIEIKDVKVKAVNVSMMKLQSLFKRTGKAKEVI